ncbi:MAG: hypothetical protein ABI693_04445 [Bryobacteraceae bacterium]
MGANPTQAAAVLLFLVAFVLVAMSLFSGGSILWLVLGAVVLAGSIMLFLKCKPWEEAE